MTKYDLDKIRKISIVDWLDKHGYKRSRGSGKYVSYFSPFGREHNASLKVNTAKNTFADYHAQRRGSIIDLLMGIEGCTLPEACEILDGNGGSIVDDYMPPITEKKGTEVHSNQFLTDKELISYFCDVRKINYDVLVKYTRQLEISFPNGKNPDARYTVCAFRNDMGGFDCRSSWQKIATSPKTITTIKGNKDKTAIWEGFTDFMSHLTYHKRLVPEYKTIVLNGLGQMNVLKPFLQGQDVLYYCDNDVPSDMCLESMDGINVTDMRHEFAFFSDYNEFLQSL